MKEKLKSVAKEYRILLIMVGVYLLGTLFGFSEKESMLLAFIVVIMTLLSRESEKREELEKRVNEIFYKDR